MIVVQCSMQWEENIEHTNGIEMNHKPIGGQVVKLDGCERYNYMHAKCQNNCKQQFQEYTKNATK